MGKGGLPGSFSNSRFSRGRNVIYSSSSDECYHSHFQTKQHPKLATIKETRHFSTGVQDTVAVNKYPEFFFKSKRHEILISLWWGVESECSQV